MIVLAGKNEIAVHGLKLALAHFNESEIFVVVNANDDGVDGWQRSFKKAAKQSGVAIITIEQAYEKQANSFISLEFDKIIDPAKFRTKNIYNIHFSLLPKYKGMYTSVWPILYGDTSSGVTLHKIDKGIDTGEIIAQVEFDIVVDDRAQDCYRKCIDSSIELLDLHFDSLVKKEPIESKLQPSNESTYHSKSEIDFSNIQMPYNKTAWQIQRYIYAFSFRPYQLVNYERRSVTDVIITTNLSELKPGTVVFENSNCVRIATIDYEIELVFDVMDDFLNNITSMAVDDLSNAIHGILGVNDRNSKGWSPIIVAAYHGKKGIIKWLLDNGANINDKNYNGTTVLMYAKDYALKSRCAKTFLWLLDNGADTTLEDHRGKNILDYITVNESEFLGLHYLGHKN